MRAWGLARRGLGSEGSDGGVRGIWAVGFGCDGAGSGAGAGQL